MLNSKQLAYLTILFLLLCLVSIFFVDQPLAYFIHEQASSLQPFFTALTSFTDLVTGYTISKYLVGGAVLLGGIVVFAIDKNIRRAKYFFFVSLTELTSRLVVGLLKNVFERERPAHFLETGNPGQTFWIAGGDSFPSGHVGRYLGVFLPLMILFPKYRAVLVIVPLYILLARLITTVHYLSDVLMSVYLVIIITSLYGNILKIGQRTEQSVSTVPEAIK